MVEKGKHGFKRLAAFAIRVGNFPLVVPVAKQHDLAAHFWRDIAKGMDMPFFHRENQVVMAAQAGGYLAGAVTRQR